MSNDKKGLSFTKSGLLALDKDIVDSSNKFDFNHQQQNEVIEEDRYSDAIPSKSHSTSRYSEMQEQMKKSIQQSSRRSSKKSIQQLN